MPFGMWCYPQAVVFKGKVYIGGGEASSDREMQTVVVYDPQQDSFDTLPLYTCKWFALATVNNQLVLVGGVDVQTDKATNKIAVWNEESRKWTHPLPPMTTACYSPSVTSHNNRWLVVMAGDGDKTCHSRVEILDTTESGQWYHAAPLPQPRYRVLTAVIGSMCYFLGGFSRTGLLATNAFCVNLDDLLSQALAGAGAPPTPSPWIPLPTPVAPGSTTFSLNGSLLTVGGNATFSTLSAIYLYQPIAHRKKWIGELPIKRALCACIVLPSGELFVTGSVYNDERVDIASIQ